MNKEYVSIATKVSTESYMMLNKLCQKKGLSVYLMLQMVVDTMVRYMSDKTNMSPEIEKAMSIFEHMQGWKEAFNLADYDTNKVVNEATYFIGDEKKRGMRAVHIDRPYFGQWSQTVNATQILEKTICIMFPELYRRLRGVGSSEECNNILETIDILCRMHEGDDDAREFRQSFEDANRSEYGVKPHEGAPYKRHLNRNIENI